MLQPPAKIIAGAKAKAKSSFFFILLFNSLMANAAIFSFKRNNIEMNTIILSIIFYITFEN